MEVNIKPQWGFYSKIGVMATNIESLWDLFEDDWHKYPTKKSRFEAIKLKKAGGAEDSYDADKYPKAIQ